jgi:Tfp pilus assembly protein PilN
MSQINFLPESFQRANRRQQRRPAEFLIIACTIVALGGLWLSMSGPDQALAQKSEQLDQSLEEIAQLHVEENRLIQERTSLQRKLLVTRETYQPISATQAISRISALVPEPVQFIKIEMDVLRPEPEAVEQPTGNKKIIGNKQAKPIEPNLMKISITGHAPSDEQLVTLIRRMDADPVFTSVALRSSKQEKTKTHFVRAFRLDVVIDLDRRFIDTKGGNTVAY